MTPSQNAAHTAVCQADPECRCPLVYFDGHAGFGTGAWRDTDDSLVARAIADAAITDHLHTRLVQDDDSDESAEWNGTEWMVTGWTTEGAVHRFASKLSAMLAAHIIRLGLPRELIDGMEKAHA